MGQNQGKRQQEDEEEREEDSSSDEEEEDDDEEEEDMSGSRILKREKRGMGEEALGVYVEEQKKMSEERKKRLNIVNEILTTEKTYVNSLLLIYELYKLPLQKSGILKADIIVELFGNIEQLLVVHLSILHQVSKVVDKWDYKNEKTMCIGHVFVNHASALRLYTRYINKYNRNLLLIQKETKSNANFRKFLSQTRNNPRSVNRDLLSYIITPVQRLPRYVLFLRDLLKNTRKDHQDFWPVSSALNRIEGVTHFINDEKREAETYQALLCLESAFSPNDLPVKIAVKGREIVYELDIFLKGDKGEREAHCWLLNDSLLLGRKQSGGMFSHFGKEMWSFLCFFPFNNNDSINDDNDIITCKKPAPRLFLDIFGCECLKEIEKEKEREKGSGSETGSERESGRGSEESEEEVERASGLEECECGTKNGCVARTEQTYLILFSDPNQKRTFASFLSTFSPFCSNVFHHPSLSSALCSIPSSYPPTPSPTSTPPPLPQVPSSPFSLSSDSSSSSTPPHSPSLSSNSSLPAAPAFSSHISSPPSISTSSPSKPPTSPRKQINISIGKRAEPRTAQKGDSGEQEEETFDKRGRSHSLTPPPTSPRSNLPTQSSSTGLSALMSKMRKRNTSPLPSNASRPNSPTTPPSPEFDNGGEVVLQAIQDLAAIFLNSSAKRLKDKGYNGSRKSSLKLPVEMSLPSTPSLSRLLSAINECATKVIDLGVAVVRMVTTEIFSPDFFILLQAELQLILFSPPPPEPPPIPTLVHYLLSSENWTEMMRLYSPVLYHALDEKEVMEIYWAVEKERKEKKEGVWSRRKTEMQIEETPKEKRKRLQWEKKTKGRIYRYVTKMAFRALFDAMMEMEVIFRSGSSFSGFSVSKEDGKRLAEISELIAVNTK